MAPTVSTKANHSRYERALSNASGKPQPKGGPSQRELHAQRKAHWAALRHQTHTSKEHLTQTVLDAVSLCLDLKKAQLAGKKTKQLLRNIMTRNAKDPAFSQFYQVCENFSNWEEVIHSFASRPQDVELNASLTSVARQIINSVIPQVETLTRTPAQSPLQFEDPTIYPLYECGECEHLFRHDGPIDENHCPACGCITHDAQLVDEPEELTEVQTYLDGSIKYIKLVGFASGFDYEDKNIEACQQTLDQIEQLIDALYPTDKIYVIWDNDQDGDGALQYVLRQLASTYSYDYLGFIRVKRDVDPDNLIREMEHFEVINVVNTTDELKDAPPDDWSFHGKIGIDKMVLHAAHQFPEPRNLAIFFVGGATTAFATSQEGQPEGEAPYYKRKYPHIPLFINENVSRNGQTSADFGWPATRGSVFQ